MTVMRENPAQSGRPPFPSRGHAVRPVRRAGGFHPHADVKTLGRSPDGAWVAAMLLFGVIASGLWLPSLGWASVPSAAVEAVAQIADEKRNRPAGPNRAAACAGQHWGGESLSCLSAIAQTAGRPARRSLRLVRWSASD